MVNTWHLLLMDVIMLIDIINQGSEINSKDCLIIILKKLLYVHCRFSALHISIALSYSMKVTLTLS